MASLSLLSADVEFLHDRLILIHIPLDLYPLFLDPILRLLFHDVPPLDDQGGELLFPEPESGLDADSPRPFINVSITPVECSVVCSRQLADLYFEPWIRKVNRYEDNRVTVSADDYLVMQVDGQGLDAGQRVLALTSPLSMAGIPIFFISTYFSDYILVPRRCRKQVTRALERNGFALISKNSYSTVGATPARSSPSDGGTPPSTPPPSSITELQARTFASLHKHGIRAQVDPSLRIVHCAAHYAEPSDNASATVLRPSLVTALVLDKPRFLSLTLSATDPAASILLETRLLPRFTHPSGYGLDYASADTNLLIGAKDDILIPIILDLRNLSLEATGIVCGVASRLAADAAQSRRGSADEAAARAVAQSASPTAHNFPVDPTPKYTEAVEISFLSTMFGGTVVVDERELDRAIDSLDVESRDFKAI